MKKLLFIIAIFIITASLQGCGTSQVEQKVKFKLATDNTYEVSAKNIYITNESELKEIDLVDYKKVFGYVKDERTAVNVATIVFNEIYKDCSIKEAPFIVKFNKNADAWIVHGTLPQNMAGGVAIIAIKKQSGEIIMLMHTK